MKNPFAVALQTLALLALLAVPLLAFTGVSSAAPLAPRATLLISLDTTQEQKKPLLGWLYRDYSRRISDKFRKILGRSGLELEIIDRANLHDLARELKNPSNVALFWLSHASDPRKILQAPLGALDPVIQDAHGSDVKRLFAHPHPNLRWLSVIACSSALILDETGEVISEANPPEIEKGQSIELPNLAPGIPPLLVQRYAVKKGAILAMGESAREARAFFRNLPAVRNGYQLKACADQDAPRPTLTVRRQSASPLEHPALAILWNEIALGSLPALPPESNQVRETPIPMERALAVLLDYARTGQARPIEVSTLFEGVRKYTKDFSLGDIELELWIPRRPPYREDFRIALSRVEKRPGVPLGTVTHLFEFKLTPGEQAELLEALEWLDPAINTLPKSLCPSLRPFMGRDFL